MLTMLPLKERASFIPSAEATTGWVPSIIETSSHLPEVVYRTFPIPMDPGRRPNHSCMTLVFSLGTKSKALYVKNSLLLLVRKPCDW